MDEQETADFPPGPCVWAKLTTGELIRLDEQETADFPPGACLTL